MILDILENLRNYKGISGHLDEAIDFICRNDFKGLETGRHEAGGGAFFLVQKPAFSGMGGTKWEAHRDFLDIQIAIDPGEWISYAPLCSVKRWETYDGQKDIVFSDDPEKGLAIDMLPGTFCIFFPEDAHRTCQSEMAGTVGHKVIFKVPLR